jgi:IS1 family transposase
MVNRLSIERRSQIIGALVEGNSIRSVERMTNTHRDTIMRLGFEVGKGCHRIMHEKMRNLPCERIQCDEIWAYVRKKQSQLKPGESIRAGDFWTFVAIDPETKLVPSYFVGKRTGANAFAFMRDLSERLTNRVQISTDGLQSYIYAVEDAFGADVDYGQVVKFYDAEPIGPGRYSPPKVTGQEKTVIAGSPDLRHISTSLVERQNLTMRMQMRRAGPLPH